MSQSVSDDIEVVIPDMQEQVGNMCLYTHPDICITLCHYIYLFISIMLIIYRPTFLSISAYIYMYIYHVSVFSLCIHLIFEIDELPSILQEKPTR